MKATNTVMNNKDFKFKQFKIRQENAKMKVGTDGILTGVLANLQNVKSALDIGTGTGLISLILAQRKSALKMDAVEIDEVAAQDALSNFEASKWADRLKVYHSSIQDFSKFQKEKYDLIITNPPFFTGGVLSYNQDRNTVRHTTKLPHSDLLKAVKTLMSKGGSFACILPVIEGKRFRELAATYGLQLSACTNVKSYVDSVVVRLFQTFGFAQTSVVEDELILYLNDKQQKTTAFSKLTKNFYL